MKKKCNDRRFIGCNSDKNLFLFFVIALGGTWTFGLIPYLLGILNTPFGNFLFYFGAGAPSVAGLVLVLFTCPKKYRGNYFKRCFSFKAIGIKRVVSVILFFSTISFLGIAIANIFLGYPLPEMEWIKILKVKPYLIVIFLLLSLLSGPINEEFGWRGYSLDRLFLRFGFIKTNLILGTAWTVWHLFWFFKSEQSQYTWVEHSWFATLSYLPSTVLLTFIVSYIYIEANRSIFGGAFVHMMSNFLNSQILSPIPIETFLVIRMTHIFLCLIAVAYMLNSKKFIFKYQRMIQEVKTEFAEISDHKYIF